MNNKPLLLRPSGKDYLWGGRRLNDEFEKGIDLSPLAETWECSTHPEGPCYVVGGEYDGKELAAVLREHPEYLGERHKGETELPILIKAVSYTHLRAHETRHDLVCRLLLEKKK